MQRRLQPDGRTLVTLQAAKRERVKAPALLRPRKRKRPEDRGERTVGKTVDHDDCIAVVDDWTEDTWHYFGRGSANGQRIADEGNREVFFTQGRGEKPRGMRAHVGDVRKGLICVAEMVDQGYEVHFGPNGHYAQRGADRVDFVRRNNVFEVEFEVVPYASTGTASMSGNGSRQGA